jgi:hypothetical protein
MGRFNANIGSTSDQRRVPVIHVANGPKLDPTLTFAKLIIKVSSGADFAAVARNSFGALVALQDLSPWWRTAAWAA